MRALGWSIIAGVFLSIYALIAAINGIKAATGIFVVSAIVVGIIVWASFLIAGGN